MPSKALCPARVLLISDHRLARHARCCCAVRRSLARSLGPTDEAILGLRNLVDSDDYYYTWLCTDAKSRDSRSRRPAGADRILPIPIRLTLPASCAELTPYAKPWRWTLIVAPAYFLFNRIAARHVRKAAAKALLRTAHGSDISGSVRFPPVR